MGIGITVDGVNHKGLANGREQVVYEFLPIFGSLSRDQEECRECT
jgi:hypothetical protein